jgi:hypothetical protein
MPTIAPIRKIDIIDAEPPLTILATAPLSVTTPEPLYPKVDDMVIRVGEILFLNWDNKDMTNVNVIFYKGTERIPLINKQVIDGQNSVNIFIDNSFFTDEFKECHIRLEMIENPSIFVETPIFKVLRTEDRSE